MASEEQAAKRALRVHLLAARDRRTKAELAAAGEALARHALGRWPGCRTVALYLSIGSEPPTGPLVDALRDAGARILLPVIAGDTLDWAAYTDASGLSPGPLGILEPTGPRLGAAAVGQAELVVVPALAVDRRGHRLGRGRGFYDRALQSLDAPVAATLFDEELLDAVPTERHDRPVSAAIVPSGVVDLDR